ncbi:hypothetical protein [Undibacterium fentianense]|uniref:Uncharacterized protein n=1 Tax=Undibacterium fentianense TaxID=2828728 RepID=A0A941IDJ2_9BURK|nr:hypothetical protein [Undibacterium fentianense]MBR7798452.1 hypothetical protein [Undibacterium fentianense]
MADVENMQAISLFDGRPFFEIALVHGVKFAIIPRSKLEAIESEAPKGLVQIADAFGSKYLRPEIELARKRIVNLASLYLLETSKGDLDVAAKLIRDNTFLTLSRGGSTLLKALHALPEYPLLGKEQKSSVEEFLEIWSLKERHQDYRNLLTHRRQNALEIEAGFWFGQTMEITQTELQEEDVEAMAVVRTGMLKRFVEDADSPIENQVEFATILESLRKRLSSRQGSKAKQILLEQAISKIRLVGEEIPGKFHPLCEQVLDEMLKRDFILVADKKNSLDRLVFELKDRYFICSHELEDTSEYDALVSKAWAKITKGKTDIDSLLTLFLCIASDIPPKTSLSEKVAKNLVKRLRDNKGSFEIQKTIDWIKQNAPYEKQEGLLDDWSAFCADAQVYLLDDWDSDCVGALRYLRENCHIEKAGKK